MAREDHYARTRPDELHDKASSEDDGAVRAIALEISRELRLAEAPSITPLDMNEAAKGARSGAASWKQHFEECARQLRRAQACRELERARLGTAVAAAKAERASRRASLRSACDAGEKGVGRALDHVMAAMKTKSAPPRYMPLLQKVALQTFSLQPELPDVSAVIRMRLVAHDAVLLGDIRRALEERDRETVLEVRRRLSTIVERAKVSEERTRLELECRLLKANWHTAIEVQKRIAAERRAEAARSDLVRTRCDLFVESARRSTLECTWRASVAAASSERCRLEAIAFAHAQRIELLETQASRQTMLINAADAAAIEAQARARSAEFRVEHLEADLVRAEAQVNSARDAALRELTPQVEDQLRAALAANDAARSNNHPAFGFHFNSYPELARTLTMRRHSAALDRLAPFYDSDRALHDDMDDDDDLLQDGPAKPKRRSTRCMKRPDKAAQKSPASLNSTPNPDSKPVRSRRCSFRRS